MTRLTLVLVLITTATFSLPASSAVNCTKGNETRRVEIVTPSEGHDLPCEVHYLVRGSEKQVLWKATTNKNYCQEKMTGFLGKLVESGFDCIED